MAEKDINKNHDLEGVKGNLITDHEYDGIQELDNKPPPWLMWILYGTIVWSVAYMFHFHVFKTGKTQEEEYAAAVEKAKANMPVVKFDENNIVLTEDEALIGEAQSYYNKECLACHGASGEGTVGPNLTDKYWKHGGTKEEVFAVIKDGAANGLMPAYKDKISNEKMAHLTAFIFKKLQGTNPANAKEPEGELVE